MLALNLLHGTGPRRFFRPPAEEFGSVTEAAAREMIELHFDDQFRRQRLPFERMLCTPAARAAGSFAGEPRRLDQFLQFFRQGWALFVADRGAKADVIE